MIKKTLILTAIIALTTSTAFAATQTTTNTQNNTTKAVNFDRPQMPPRGEMRGPHVNFEERLNLTEKQKAQVKKNRETDRAKIEPLMKQIREKETAKREIIKKYEQTDPQLIKLNNEIKALRDKKHNIMEENRKSFEAMLTKEQKAELEKIKAEHKKKFENGQIPVPPRHPEYRKF